jgi:hypothetical protein
MLPLIALAALIAIAGTLAAPYLVDAAPAARIHLTFAIGIAPLILAALGYFVPVLTRSSPAPQPVLAAPFVALASGVVVVAYFVAPEAWPSAYLAAALLLLATAAAMAGWMFARGRKALDAPHPCLAWYVAAVACLGVALVAVLAMPLAPAHYPALKRLHLHLSLLGFVGLTALGTLQVLAPTAAGAPDPSAPGRLARDLKYALAGTVLIALGAAWQALVAALGLFFWLSLAIRLARDWLTLYRDGILAPHGALPSLAGALVGLIAVLLLGAMHGGGGLPPADATIAFIFAFLLPLVTGALTQLLPPWLRPGAQTPRHVELRAALGRHAAVRTVLFLGGGMAAGFGVRGAPVLAALGLAIFLVQVIRAVASSNQE